MPERPETQWHLDRRVPITLIAAIVFQTGGWLWWASAINTRVNQLETASVASAGQNSRIVRLETKMDSIFESLTEIKAILVRQGKTP